MTIETIKISIDNFMDNEYSIHPNQSSIEILLEAGFSLSQDPEKQYQNCNRVQKRIKPQGLDNLVAKVFSLAYPYNFLLAEEHKDLVTWSSWLGMTEFKLGVVIEDIRIKKNLFEKSLKHFSKAREKGDDSKENTSYIGNCHFKLERCEKARDFFLEARRKGNYTPENTGLIGDCYFYLKKYKKALPFLLESIKKRQVKETAGHIAICYSKSGDYEKAKDFFLESRKMGNDSKENGSYLGSCYFRLKKYAQGISEYENALKITIQEDFDPYWMHTFNYLLENSFALLTKQKNSISTLIYKDLLQRFKVLYDNFVHYWKENQQKKETYFKLKYCDKQPLDKTANALSELSQ